MIARRRPMMLAMALIALCAAAVPASAQITTGSVAGTVKDPQGGVIPGAPVTLISETRGTQLSDVFSNSSGDFSFVNVPPDRYTLQVSMTGFKTAKRTGISVSAGDRALSRRGHHRSRRPDRDHPGNRARPPSSTRKAANARSR